jgi:hypothetical protein
MALTRLTLLLMATVLFHAVLLVAFVVGFPIRFPVAAPLATAAVVIAVDLAFVAGCLLAAGFLRPTRTAPASMRGIRAFALPTLLLWSVWMIWGWGVYTSFDFSFGALLARLRDSGLAYAALQQTLTTTTTGDRSVFLAFKTLFAPLIMIGGFLPLYLAIHTRSWRIGAAAVLTITLLTSVVRGSDKFFVESLVLLATLVALQWSLGAPPRRRRTGRTTVMVTLAVALTIGAGFLFVQRRIDRVGSDLTVACAPDLLRADCVHPAVDALPDAAGYAITLAGAYLIQGHVGLSILMAHPVSTTYAFGFGHTSALAMPMGWLLPAELQAPANRAISAAGWDVGGQWIHGIAWLANDMPPHLVPLFAFLAGLVAGMAWQDHRRNGGWLASFVASYGFMTFLMLPLGLPILQTTEAWFGFMAVFAWYAGRTLVRRLARPTGVAVG